MHKLRVVVAALALSAACSQSPNKEEQPAAKSDARAGGSASVPALKKSYVFRGKVEKVNAAGKALTVNGENVEGWMSAMTMDYAPANQAIFDTVKVGDEITAQVFDGDFSTLHDVKVVTPAQP